MEGGKPPTLFTSHEDGRLTIGMLPEDGGRAYRRAAGGHFLSAAILGSAAGGVLGMGGLGAALVALLPGAVGLLFAYSGLRALQDVEHPEWIVIDDDGLYLVLHNEDGNWREERLRWWWDLRLTVYEGRRPRAMLKLQTEAGERRLYLSQAPGHQRVQHLYDLLKPHVREGRPSPPFDD